MGRARSAHAGLAQRKRGLAEGGKIRIAAAGSPASLVRPTPEAAPALRTQSLTCRCEPGNHFFM